MTFDATPEPGQDLLVALERRVASNGSSPLLTWYDLDKGQRTELSGRTFANWVDKSANLLVSMDLDEFPRVANTLLVTHPGNWVGLVWTMAVWQLGGVVVATERQRLTSTDLLDAAVVGPSDAHPVPGVETIGCSLHPLGAGFETRPLGVTDYFEVLSQPDVHWRVPAVSPICFEDTRTFSWDDLSRVEAITDRRVVLPSDDPWLTVCEAVVAPVLGGGSAVILVGGDAEQRTDTAGQERARLP